MSSFYQHCQAENQYFKGGEMGLKCHEFESRPHRKRLIFNKLALKIGLFDF